VAIDSTPRFCFASGECLLTAKNQYFNTLIPTNNQRFNIG